MYVCMYIYIYIYIHIYLSWDEGPCGAAPRAGRSTRQDLRPLSLHFCLFASTAPFVASLSEYVLCLFFSLFSFVVSQSFRFSVLFCRFYVVSLSEYASAVSLQALLSFTLASRCLFVSTSTTQVFLFRRLSATLCNPSQVGFSMEASGPRPTNPFRAAGNNNNNNNNNNNDNDNNTNNINNNHDNSNTNININIKQQ